MTCGEGRGRQGVLRIRACRSWCSTTRWLGLIKVKADLAASSRSTARAAEGVSIATPPPAIISASRARDCALTTRPRSRRRVTAALRAARPDRDRGPVGGFGALLETVYDDPPFALRATADRSQRDRRPARPLPRRRRGRPGGGKGPHPALASRRPPPPAPPPAAAGREEREFSARATTKFFLFSAQEPPRICPSPSPTRPPARPASPAPCSTTSRPPLQVDDVNKILEIPRQRTRRPLRRTLGEREVRSWRRGALDALTHGDDLSGGQLHQRLLLLHASHGAAARKAGMSEAIVSASSCSCRHWRTRPNRLAKRLPRGRSNKGRSRRAFAVEATADKMVRQKARHPRRRPLSFPPPLWWRDSRRGSPACTCHGVQPSLRTPRGGANAWKVSAMSPKHGLTIDPCSMSCTPVKRDTQNRGPDTAKKQDHGPRIYRETTPVFPVNTGEIQGDLQGPGGCRQSRPGRGLAWASHSRIFRLNPHALCGNS